MGAIISPLTGSVYLPTPAPTIVEPSVDPAEASSKAAAATRRATLERQKNGRLGTIATSARGVLSPGHLAVVRRSLFGE
jgi:hypothetical protein